MKKAIGKHAYSVSCNYVVDQIYQINELLNYVWT